MEAASILRWICLASGFSYIVSFPFLEIKAEAPRCTIELALRLANMM
jgi:hypothetical protein